MAMFISLVNLTEQGVKAYKDSPDRAAAFTTMAQKANVTVKDIYWTMGTYDVVIIMEADNDESVAALMLSLCSLGNVKTQTLRAFTAAEMRQIVSKV